MTQHAVELHHVSKRYRIGRLSTFRDTLAALSRRRPGQAQDVLWALRDVSLQLDPGESLGLIGPNGAGKTTILKLLSNITQPTSGEVIVRGRVSSLIELGAGFHPELTGRENIFLNGAILGLKRREIARKLDAIIAFSELERFIDTPVKRYSSGMYVRLGFAVAAHVEPDILLVDEVLAVGDASFRQRCMQRMHELQRNGTTVVFVSHNMHLVREMCDSAILLMEGQVRAQGEPSAVIAEYERILLQCGTGGELQRDEDDHPAFDSEGNLILTAIEVLPIGRGASEPSTHLPATVRIHYHAIRPQQVGRIEVLIIREDGTVCVAVDSSLSTARDPAFSELSGSGVLAITYEPLQLAAGVYVAEVMITDASDNLVIASGRSSRFHVHGYSTQPQGVYLPQVRWAKQPVEPVQTYRAQA